ncbi:MAG: sulfotransferase, partial [Gemmatimonadota bacterium]
MGTGESGSRRPPDRRRWFPLPDFLGIGAMRAGTSWLAEHLAKHPEISMPRKEIHFFNRRFDRQLIPLLPRSVEARMRYRARFVGAGLSGRLTGEFTPAYALLDPDRIATVHEWMPRARLLFIMRDPVDRAWSQAKHDYAGWLGRDAATAPEEELRAFFARPRVQQRADYATSLENWLRCFDRGQLFMTFLEHVKADPAPV